MPSGHRLEFSKSSLFFFLFFSSSFFYLYISHWIILNSFLVAASKFTASFTSCALVCHKVLFWSLYSFWYIWSLWSTFVITDTQMTFNYISLLNIKMFLSSRSCIGAKTHNLLWLIKRKQKYLFVALVRFVPKVMKTWGPFCKSGEET